MSSELDRQHIQSQNEINWNSRKRFHLFLFSFI